MRDRTYAYLSHVLPFLVFALFTVAGGTFGLPRGIAYPLKTLLTGVCLIWAWKGFRDEIRWTFSWEAVLAGVGVFLLWIGLDGFYPHIGESSFDPYQEAAGRLVYGLVAVRVIGAVLVVPVMEEVFWRSFVLRFVLDKNFFVIPLGFFSWYSFSVNVLLFGFEHHRWLAGILAGVVYTVLLYRTKNLFVPILSHAVTNLLLAGYVIHTGNWTFW